MYIFSTPFCCLLLFLVARWHFFADCSQQQPPWCCTDPPSEGWVWLKMAAFSQTWWDSEVDALINIWSIATIQKQWDNTLTKMLCFCALSTCHPCKSRRNIARSDICHCVSLAASWSLHSSDARRLLAASEHNQTATWLPVAPRTLFWTWLFTHRAMYFSTAIMVVWT